MDLNAAVRTELARVIPVIQNTFTFSVSFNAAQRLLENRGESGPYMVATSMTALLLLLGAQIKCQRCESATVGAWYSPLLTLTSALLNAGVSLATTFCSNLFAAVLVAVLAEASSDLWLVWWGVSGLALTTIGVRFVM